MDAGDDLLVVNGQLTEAGRREAEASRIVPLPDNGRINSNMEEDGDALMKSPKTDQRKDLKRPGGPSPLGAAISQAGTPGFTGVIANIPPFPSASSSSGLLPQPPVMADINQLKPQCPEGIEQSMFDVQWTMLSAIMPALQAQQNMVIQQIQRDLQQTVQSTEKMHSAVKEHDQKLKEHDHTLNEHGEQIKFLMSNAKGKGKGNETLPPSSPRSALPSTSTDYVRFYGDHPCDDHWEMLPIHARRVGLIGNLGFDLNQETLVQRAKAILTEVGISAIAWDVQQIPGSMLFLYFESPVLLKRACRLIREAQKKYIDEGKCVYLTIRKTNPEREPGKQLRILAAAMTEIVKKRSDYQGEIFHANNRFRTIELNDFSIGSMRSQDFCFTKTVLHQPELDELKRRFFWVKASHQNS